MLRKNYSKHESLKDDEEIYIAPKISNLGKDEKKYAPILLSLKIVTDFLKTLCNEKVRKVIICIASLFEQHDALCSVGDAPNIFRGKKIF